MLRFMRISIDFWQALVFLLSTDPRCSKTAYFVFKHACISTAQFFYGTRNMFFRTAPTSADVTMVALATISRAHAPARRVGRDRFASRAVQRARTARDAKASANVKTEARAPQTLVVVTALQDGR